jgi:hypothetical protein
MGVLKFPTVHRSDKLTPVRLFLLAAVILALCATAAGQRKKKPADIEVVETRAHRVEGKITLDGRVRFTGERPAHGLVVVFDFLSPEHEVVTSQKTQLADDVVRAGQEASYQTVLVDPVRAISYQVRALDNGERELRVGNPGPYPIE